MYHSIIALQSIEISGIGDLKMKKILNHTILTCVILFVIMIIVHGFEAIVLRMDETILAENFINKLFGIAVFAVVLRILGWKMKDIGFKKEGMLRNILLGLMIGAAAFIIAYGVELLILTSQHKSFHFGIFTTGFSLTDETVINTGIGYILMCIFFNIINVIMEEGTFRGLFGKLVNTDHSLKTAIMFQASLFGVWHIVTPLHNLIDGDITVGTFIILAVGYIILAGMMGIKWGYLKEMTGSLYTGMADHFFNNCIATNLLHVVTPDGTDEMMLVRVLIAQVISFVAVLIAWKKYNAKH